MNEFLECVLTMEMIIVGVLILLLFLLIHLTCTTGQRKNGLRDSKKMLRMWH